MNLFDTPMIDSLQNISLAPKRQLRLHKTLFIISSNKVCILIKLIRKHCTSALNYHQKQWIDMTGFQLEVVTMHRWKKLIFVLDTKLDLSHHILKQLASAWSCSTGSQKINLIISKHVSQLLQFPKNRQKMCYVRFPTWQLIFRGCICDCQTALIVSLSKANAAKEENSVEYHWMTLPSWTVTDLVRSTMV